MGRVLEVRHWMVKLNGGNDALQLDDILVDLKLTPDVLEVRRGETQLSRSRLVRVFHAVMCCSFRSPHVLAVLLPLFACQSIVLTDSSGACSGIFR